jgi:hypothetical protein
MNLQLRSRTDPMLSHAYPVCARSDSNRPKLHLLAHAKITAKHIRCNQPAIPTHSPYPNQTIPPLHKQRTHIQRP